MALLISQLTNSILIQRYAENVASKAASKLTKREKKIREYVEAKLPLILSNQYDLENKRRIKKLSKRIRDLIYIAVLEAETSIYEDTEDLIAEQIFFQKESYLKATDGSLILKGSPKSETMREVKLTPYIAGATIWEALRAIPNRREDLLKKELANAVYSSAEFSDVKTRIFGTKIKNSGIIGNAKRNIQTIAKTAVNFAVNDLKKNIALANGVEEYLFYAILDSRTSEICGSNAGLRFRFDNPEAPIPPLHPNCRSTIVFYTDEFKSKDLVKEQNYDEWLAKKPASYQDNVLGPTKGKLFREGGFKVKDFVGSDYKPISISELRSTNKETFERLGL